MCELMGMSFERPAEADFSMREFALRGEENADGWGLGWYPDRSLAIIKEPVKWRESRYADFLENDQELRSHLFVAHVRHKTVGAESTRADTHPFAREWGGREYCFGHNGTLDDFEQLPLGRFRPLGGTDSEHAFCHLLERIAQRGGALDDEAGWRWLYEECCRLNRLGKFNVLLADGERLFVYHDIHGWKGLNFRTLRLRAGAVRRFADPDLAVELEGGTANRGTVVATRPLSASGWHSFRLGELIVLERGEIRYSSHRARQGDEDEVPKLASA